jgi:hypothetical protein
MKRLVFLAGRAERENPNPSDGHRRVTAHAVCTALSNGAASDCNEGFGLRGDLEWLVDEHSRVSTARAAGFACPSPEAWFVSRGRVRAFEGMPR